MRNFTDTDSFEHRKTTDQQISVELMDKLIDIITLSTFCFLEYSPKLIDLIKTTDDISKYPMLLVSDFRVPKVNLDAECQLSYGSLLCTAHLYIKALQQICTKKRASGNRREILTARKRTESIQNSESDKQQTAQSPTIASGTPESPKDYKRLRKVPVTAPQGVAEYPQTGVTTLLTNINAYKLNSIQTFATSSTSSMCAPWLARLSEQKVYRSLEAVMTLVAEQAVLTLNDATVDRKDMKFIRRELFSELQIFHEFVKKRLMDLHRYNATDKTILMRKKFGTITYVSASEHKFRHNVIRELTNRHVENVLSHRSHNEIAPVRESLAGGDSPAPEPIPPELYRGMCEVKIVEEDYVHMLSNWFINKCNLHH